MSSILSASNPKNSSIPSSTAEMLVDEARQEIGAFLSYLNSSNEDPEFSGLQEEGNLGLNQSSTGFLLDSLTEGGTTVSTTVNSVIKNVTNMYGNGTLSETLEFAATNNTLIGNLTMNSTLTDGRNSRHAGVREVVFLALALTVCAALILVQLIQLARKPRRTGSEEDFSTSQVVAKYRARYPQIVEERESDLESNPEENQSKGDSRQNIPLVSCSPPKNRKNKEYTSLPIAWDFERKIVAQEEASTDEAGAAKDIESQNQKPGEHKDSTLTPEHIQQLKEEYETLLARLTED